MYNCEVCTTPSKPNTKVFKILLFRVVNSRREIEKEICACQLCYEGYHKGIPLTSLAGMHRPVSPTSPPVSPLGGSPALRTGEQMPAPPAGASRGTLSTLYGGPAAGPIPYSSPKEQRPPVLLGASKAEKLIAQQEERGKKRKPLKPLIKRGRNADYPKDKVRPKGK